LEVIDMATPLNPQEVYLLERYSSLEYFGELRDHFAAMVKAGEQALAEFMRQLPPDYRSLPLYDQPDVTWGETVLPNLRSTLEGLNQGYIRISHGDLEGLGQALSVRSAFAGMRRDFSSDWMSRAFEAQFDSECRKCSRPSTNISITAQAEWCCRDLNTLYTDESRGPLNAPPSWPKYRLNPRVRVKTDDRVPQDGVYLPDTPSSCAQFLTKGYVAWGATVLENPDNPEDQGFTRVATTWTLVRKTRRSPAFAYARQPANVAHRRVIGSRPPEPTLAVGLESAS